MFGALPAYGLFCRHVEDLTLSKIHFDYGDGFWRLSIGLEDENRLPLRSSGSSIPVKQGAGRCSAARLVSNAKVGQMCTDDEGSITIMIHSHSTVHHSE